MVQMVALPNYETPVRILYEPGEGSTIESYLAFCAANPDLRVERTAQGEIIEGKVDSFARDF